MLAPSWVRMPKWQLKLMDMLADKEVVQREVDYLLDSCYPTKVSIDDQAVFILKVTGSTADYPKRFPLSKLRKDQLDKIRLIMEADSQKE